VGSAGRMVTDNGKTYMLRKEPAATPHCPPHNLHEGSELSTELLLLLLVGMVRVNNYDFKIQP